MVRSKKNKNKCLLCSTIKDIEVHDNTLSLLKDVNQWDIKGSTQMKRICYFQCFVCNFYTKKFECWKKHIISVNHISVCHKVVDLHSYSCAGCKTQLYGTQQQIQLHRWQYHLDHSNLPLISICMKELLTYYNVDPNTLYFCSNKSHKSFLEMPCNHMHMYKLQYHCRYCRVTFFCSAEVLDCHFLSVEHVTLKCICLINEGFELKRVQKKPISSLNTLPFVLTPTKLPSYVQSRFKKISDLMTQCKVCCTLVDWNVEKMVKHPFTCLGLNTNRTLITTYDCNVCNWVTQSFSNYVDHVISPIHLYNSRYIGNYFSYFCSICNYYIYSKKSIIKEHWNSHQGCKQFTEVPIISQVLASNFANRVRHSTNDILDYCDKKQCRKKVSDIFLFECHTCKINFCISSADDYNLHAISSEHIILKYFNPCALLNVSISDGKPSKCKIDTNKDLIINSKSSGQLSDKNDDSVQGLQVYKGQKNKTNVFDNTIIKSIESFENNNSSANLLNASTIHQNKHDNERSQVYFSKQFGTTQNMGSHVVTSPITVQNTLGYEDLLIDSDYAMDDFEYVWFDEFESIIQDKSLYGKTQNISETPLKNLSISTLNVPIKEVKQYIPPESINNVETYGQYIDQKLEQINNISIQSEVKREIDDLLNSKIIQTTAKDTAGN